LNETDVTVIDIGHSNIRFRSVLIDMSNKYQWLWRSNSSCSVSNDTKEWRQYSDVEMSIIEDAYQQKREQVELDNYIIDLKSCLQINKLNQVEKKPVKRISDEAIRYSREKYFFLSRRDGLRPRRKSCDEKYRCK
jgi:hypothetical protein